MLVFVVHSFLEKLIIAKICRLKSTRAGACIIQILQELELEPALLKTKGLGEFHKHSHSTQVGLQQHLCL